GRVEEEDQRGRSGQVERRVHPRVERPLECGGEVVEREDDGDSADHPCPPTEIRAEPTRGGDVAQHLLRRQFGCRLRAGSRPGPRISRPGRCRLATHGRSTHPSSKYFSPPGRRGPSPTPCIALSFPMSSPTSS